MNLKHRLLLLTTTLLLSPAIALAQADDVTVLPEVTVNSSATNPQQRGTTTSAFTPRQRGNSTSTFVIDEQTIRSSSANNLSELLIEQGFPVEATPNDHGENTLVIRGFHTEHLMTEANGKVLILIDGRRSGVASVRQIALRNVERIEVLRGAEMFKYGLGSPGGIINVITKRGGPNSFGGSVRAGYGSYDAYRTGVDVGGQQNNFDYTIGYEYSTVRSDYTDGDGNRVHNTKTDGTNRFNFNFGYTIDGLHRIGIDGYHYAVDKAHRPSYIDEEGVLRGNNYTDRKTQLLHLNYQGASEDGRFSWRANVGKGRDLYETWQATNAVMHQYPKGQDVTSDRAQGSLTYTSDLFDLTGGMDYIHYFVQNSSTARGNALASPCTHALADPEWCGKGFPMHPTSTTTLMGSYLVGMLKLWDGAVNLSGGVRYEHASARDLSVGDEHYDRTPGLRNYFGGLPREAFPTSRSFDHIAPTFGATWLPMDWLKLRANYTQGWRAPSGRQLFASSFYEDYGAPGDPRLRPEFTDAYEVGFDMARGDWRLSSTYFYYKVKDNIFIYPGYLADGRHSGARMLLNVDKRIQEGVEVQVSANVAGLLGRRDMEVRPYANLTHMIKKEEVIFEGAPGPAGTWWPITRMPDTVMNYGIRFNYPAWQFSGNLNFNYYGLQYGGRADVGLGPIPGFGRFTVANLSLRKRLLGGMNTNNLDLKLDANNLFNTTYSYLGPVGTGPNDSYAFPGRNFFATLIYNF